jgi:hypothetical protein
VSVRAFVFPALGLVTMSSACGAGWTQAHFDNNTRELKPRASFDMKCPEGRLSLRSLDDAAFPHAVAVTGCGKQASYLKTKSGWHLDSDIVDGAGTTANKAAR